MNPTNKFFTVGSFISAEASGLLPAYQRTLDAIVSATTDACYVNYSATQCAQLSYDLGKLRTVNAHSYGIPAGRSLAAAQAAPQSAHATLLAALATIGATPSLATVTSGGGTTLAVDQPFQPTIL